MTGATEEPLSRQGRVVRVTVTGICALLLLAGTLFGSDDHFPFGPFRMYAGVNGPDDDAPDPRVEAVDTTGRLVVLNERNTGIRRAEYEGQEASFVNHPERLESLATAYERLNPTAPPVVRVRLVMRWHDIEDSRVVGTWRDELLAEWQRQR